MGFPGKTVFIALMVTVVGLIANVNSLECIACRSDELTECSTLGFAPVGNITELPAVTCEVNQVECETRVTDNGITWRGCKALDTTCAGATCTTCQGDRCNGQIFPADRRSCLQCEGAECEVQQTAFACPNYASVDSCYAVFSKDGKTTYRGCSSDADQTFGSRYCNDVRELCIRCSVNGCNTASAIIQDNPLSCVKCDSLSDPRCARLTDQHAATPCGLISHGNVDACFAHVVDGVLHRGCLSEVHALEQDCRNGSAVCELCSEANCNRRTIETEVCLECDAALDGNCRGSLSANSTLMAECPLRLQPLGCYHYDDGGVDLKRGCLSSLVNDEIRMCNRQQAECKVCKGDGCNRLARFQRCQVCDSDRTLSCFGDASTTESRVCRDYQDVCLVRIANNAVQRSCVNPETIRSATCQFPAQCETCEGEDNCNAVTVAAVDFCYTCDSRTDPNCRDGLNEEMQTQCTFSVGSKGCYREESEDGHVRRGCLNSLANSEAEQCLEQGENCKTCSGTYCNAKVGFQRCRQCTSTSSSSCFRSPGSFASVLCSGYLDECFVHLENDVVSRGCVSAASAAIQEKCVNGSGEFCETCGHSNSCNNKIIDGEFCMTCDVASDPGCLAAANFTMRTQCPLAINKRGCYLFNDGGDTTVKRGCVADLVPDEISMCRRQGRECKTCIGDDCNVKPTFQRCMACNSTQNVNCIRAGTSFASVDCRLYHDECYTYADSNNVVTRGCLSDVAVTPQVVESCKGQGDSCNTCTDANGCNSKVVDGEFCLQCDSTYDPDCVSNANFTMRKQCPLSPNRVGCYLFDDGGEIVKRGCVADLTSNEIQMCRQERGECKTCIGDDCNAQPKFQSCRTCNSTQNVNCIRSSGAVSSVQCRKYTDQCYVHVDNNVVTRGCLAVSPLDDAERTVCMSGDNENCQTCNGNSNCNNQLVDGEFCITCDSKFDANCHSSTNFTMRKQCPLSVKPMGCYLFNDGGDDVKRGCVADIVEDEQNFCRKQGSECKTCIGNDCNAKPAFQRCRQCNSTQSVNCIRAPDSFLSVECKHYDDVCYLHVVNDIVTRGCLKETTATQITSACSSDSSDFCQTCSNANMCNNRIVDGEFCLTCDSESDPNCVSNANFTMRTQCPLSPSPRGCYRSQDGDVIKRGCVADLTEDEIDTCRLEGRNCKTCIGNDCNAKPMFQYCRACNSSNNVNCIRSPNSFSAVLCDDYMDECYTHVENNIVTRGCLATTAPAVKGICGSNGELCETCSNGPSCNNKIVDGEFCIACRSEWDPNCHSSLNHTMREQCPLSVSPRGCYTFDDGGDQQVRGCMAKLTNDEQNMCNENGLYCKTCRGNDCNAKVSFTSCKKCNSTTDGTACIRGASTAPSVTCRDYMDECVSHVLNDVVVRGCLAEIDVPKVQEHCRGTPDSDFCHKCSTKDCNSQIVDGEFCITCDSDKDPNCVSNTNYTMRVQCPLAVEQRGCYRFQEGDTVKRGCLADIDPDEIAFCRTQGSCKTCIGNDCNQKPTIHSCRSCSSADNVNCIRAPNSFAAVTCRNYHDTCYTHVDDNIVTRGCLSSLIEGVPQDCSGSNNDLCEKCDSLNCNNRVVDGEFCLHCDTLTDPMCRSNANFTMRTQCQLAVKPRGCYLYDDGGDVVKRGCVSDIHPDEIRMCRRERDECKTCIGDDCNAKPKFQRCRTCNSSNSVNCIRSPGSFASQLCPNYQDECFTHVQDDIVTRGCLARATASVRQTCLDNPDLCNKCSSGDNCNNRLVDGEFCLSCDSATDPKCRDTPDFTHRKQCPLSAQPRGCYLFDDGGDIVKRGCVADITPDEINMCRRQGDQCKTCVGNDCNQKPRFQQCKVCNSTENVDCIRYVVNYIDSKTCTNYGDECFVHVVNNTIVRGCLGDNADLVEDCTDPRKCEKCGTGQSCNNKIVDGEFCITCNSDTDPTCRTGGNFTLRTQCNLSVNPIGCYHHELGDNKVERGCLNNLTPAKQTECDNDDHCKTCIGNDCNVLESLPSCVVCDSAVDANCVTPNENSNVQSCQEYGGQCFTHIDGQRVRRGCLLDVVADIRAECEANNGSCEVCDGGNCNKRSVEPEFCYTCNSTVDSRCTTGVDDSQRMACTDLRYNFDRRGCYRWENDDGSVQRGCVNTLSSEFQDFCNTQDGCKTCTDNNCNEKATFQTCYQCDSSHDPNCLELLDTSSTSTQCRNYVDACKTLITENGKTVRGCASDLIGVPTTVHQECPGNNCNAGVYPQDRLKCHQCSGSGCNEELLPTSSQHKYCDNFLVNDECYGFTDDNGNMNRGCLSDVDASKCTDVGKRCSFCRNSDGCNSQAQYRPSSLSCIQCSGTSSECRWGFQGTEATNCVGLVGYGLNQSCYTLETATHVERGCQINLDSEICVGDGCRYCSDEACNRYNVARQTCQVCASDVEGEELCNETDIIGFEKTCSSADEIVEYANRGCFTRNQDNKIARGCAATLTAEEVEVCNDAESNVCDWCEGENCNTKAPPSSANVLSTLSVLALLAMASVSLWF